MSYTTPSATVILPTRNRKDLLRTALASSFAQTVPVEVIVLDDGSTDGTGDMVRKEFPRAIYHPFDGPKGPCFLRNRGAKLAHGEFLFPIDDDAAFVSRNTVEQTIAEFSTPQIGAVGIPYMNVRINQDVRQRAPDDNEIYLTSAFVGASHAVRKSAFMAVHGYHDDMFYMGEESDLCLRMLACGYVVRLGMADPIEHHESPIRNSKWADLYGRRNDVMCAWENVPFSKMPGRIASVTVNGLKHGRKVGRSWRMVQGLLWGYGSIVTHLFRRKAVPLATYQLFRRLSHETLTLRSVYPLLPQLMSERRRSKGVRKAL